MPVKQFPRVGYIPPHTVAPAPLRTCHPDRCVARLVPASFIHETSPRAKACLRNGMRWYEIRRMPLLLLFLVSLGCASGRYHIQPYEKETLAQLNLVKQKIHVGNQADPIKVGTEKVDITPPVGTPLAGFGRRKGRPSAGVRDPLFARVLVVRDGQDTVAWVSLDMMAVHEDFFRAVWTRLDPALNISEEDLYLMATHTHSGSGGLTKRWTYERVSGSFDQDVFDETAGRIASAIKEAASNLESSRWGFGMKKLEKVNLNRMKEGGVVDDECLVVRMDGQDGTPRAFMVNFSAHPTILGSSNFEFSADFPGFLAGAVEAAFPGSVCLFINGASADIKPGTQTRPTDYEEAEEYGTRIGRHAVEIANRIDTKSVTEVVSMNMKTRLPPVRVHYGWLAAPSWLGGRFFDRETHIGAVRVDKLLFLSVPGELGVDIGLALEERIRSKGFEPVLMGYTNGYIGYILRKEDYDLSEYESRVSFYGSDLGPFMQKILEIEADILMEAY